MKISMMAETFAGVIFDRFVGEEGFLIHEVEHEIRSSVNMAGYQAGYKFGRSVRNGGRIAQPQVLPTTLYSTDGRLTSLGSEAAREVAQAIKPILNRFLAQGHSPRDLSLLVSEEATQWELGEVLRLQAELRES